MYFNPKESSTAPQASVITENIADISSGSGENNLAARAKQALMSYHSTSKVDFKLTNKLALEYGVELLEYFFPDGEKRGGNYLIFNPHREDNTLGSFSINLEEGYWKDFADDDAKGSDLISLIAFAFKDSQQKAALDILNFIEGQRREISDPVKRGAKHKAADKPTFTPVMPIPLAAIKIRPCYFSQTLGDPTATWTYKNAGGDALFYVHRFDTAEGKSFRPSIYCKDESGRFLWKNIAPPTPRPAYGLDRLAARPDAPVLFTEGEKAADAGQRLFPDYVVVTTMNGAQSPEKTDFTPFSGRKIYIAPDNDEPGIAYKGKLIHLLNAAGAEVMAELFLPVLIRNDQPLGKGYDLADAELSGWTATELASIGDALWEPITIPPQDTAPASSANIKRIIPSGFWGIAIKFAIDNLTKILFSLIIKRMDIRKAIGMR